MSDLYEVVINQLFKNQLCVSRLNYLMTGTPASVSGSFALVKALGAIPSAGIYPSSTFMSTLAQLQSEDVAYQDISAKNIYSVTDFYETPFVPPYIGTVSGDSESPALAYGFTSSRVRTDINRGQKRFVGVAESVTGSGGVIDPTSVLFTGMAEVLGITLEYDDEGTTLSFAPCIVCKERYEVEVDGEPTGRFAYRYYTSEATQLDHLAIGGAWSVKPNVRTQVSRQYGRGS